MSVSGGNVNWESAWRSSDRGVWLTFKDLLYGCPEFSQWCVLPHSSWIEEVEPNHELLLNQANSSSPLTAPSSRVL